MKKIRFVILLSAIIIALFNKSDDSNISNNLVLDKKEVPKDVLHKLGKAQFSTTNAFLTTYEGKEVLAVEDMFLMLKEINELTEEFGDSGNIQNHYRTRI